MACIWAPASLIAPLAQESNLTLVGFLRGKWLVICTGEERVRLGR